MDFKWTEECSEMVKQYRASDRSKRKTLDVKEFVKLLNEHL